ncbi:MAG: hypothetical protein ACXQTP_03435 [Candidatus Methanofastidiosia archaeon]
MKMRKIPLLVFIIGVALIVFGSLQGQVSHSNNISSFICLSCLGITPDTAGEELTQNDLIALNSIKNEVTIYIFSTEDCLSCPEVVAKCEEIAGVCPRITTMEVKYEKDVALFESLSQKYEVNIYEGVPWITVVDYEENFSSFIVKDKYVKQIIDLVVEFGN